MGDERDHDLEPLPEGTELREDEPVLPPEEEAARKPEAGEEESDG